MFPRRESWPSLDLTEFAVAFGAPWSCLRRPGDWSASVLGLLMIEIDP
jgi:hypothetical protein